ncbi:hypothetical protein H6P81_001423 [Aristolochia fimbriata]|uniref:DUF7804 domain-containing protein n=1 Tax=Aristolochia fimbriata TaxID=158543 RepID=A0AAV7F6U5_ARIFI|nr:hypothetical protein H6P81_001423 [Aristolochia fimbriata]
MGLCRGQQETGPSRWSEDSELLTPTWRSESACKNVASRARGMSSHVGLFYKIPFPDLAVEVANARRVSFLHAPSLSLDPIPGRKDCCQGRNARRTNSPSFILFFFFFSRFSCDVSLFPFTKILRTVSLMASASASAAASSMGFQPGRDLFNARKRNGLHRTAYCRLGMSSSVQAGGSCLVPDRREQNSIPISFSSKGKESGDDESIVPEMLDEWISESVTEIVRNVGDAPLLLQLYSKPNQGSKVKLEKQKAVAESWPLLKRRWKEGSRVPLGVILVERLKGMEDDGSAYWGLLVQGRGLHCGACYILKTNRVQSVSGFCTYFCLARAKCFGESPDLQMRDSWLLLRASDSSLHCSC